LAWNFGLEPATANANLLGIASRLVTAYLRNLCERRLRVEDVLVDLAAFVERQGGIVDVEKVREVLWVAGKADRGSCGRPRRKAVAVAL